MTAITSFHTKVLPHRLSSNTHAEASTGCLLALMFVVPDP